MLGVQGLYGHIQRNNLKSAALLVGFTALIVLTWYAWCIVYTAIVDVWWPHVAHRSRHTAGIDVLDILEKALDVATFRWWVPLLITAIWFVVAYLIHAEMIRLATGARALTRKEAPRLYNMIENLAISAGLPMPRVEVINTGALNAYASGLGPDDSVITVTQSSKRSSPTR
jgi:heat shock protein HtpX